jgi:serine/threonine protein kinase/formylglycine-generating enzyme required for sulfatase activity
VPPGEFEEYRLLKQIGQGGMGSVFLAHDQLLDRTVAIKFISADPDGDSRARFLIEGRAAARLTHPNVVAVHRVGEIQGRPYIVSEYVRGKTLAMLDMPVPLRQALELGLQLARGLASAHRQGVVHRDLKPGNAVLTEDGVVKILDFGLAKLVPLGLSRPAEPLPAAVVIATSPYHEVMTAQAAANETARLPAVAPATLGASSPLMTASPVTRVGAVVGTPHYMAPEVWQNLAATPRADVYALGAVIYELISGAPPFADHDHLPLAELGIIVRDREVPSLATQVPNLDPRFVALVDRCLRRDPGDRFASGEEAREALELLALGPVARASSHDDLDPYPGLATFEADDRAVFFGRGSETRAIVERLRATHLVLVAGDSGVGKSSICRAGVLPLVTEGGLGEVRVWQSITVTVGQHPVASLAAALAPLLGRDHDSTVALAKGEVRALVRELRSYLRDRRGLLFFFDQLEELVTLSASDEARVIADLLREIGQGPPGIRALATVRGDYLTRVAALPGLADEAARALYLLGPLGPAAIKQAIEGPALAHGVRFESPALIEELASATAAAEGGLPLLQFALAELWQARDRQHALITASALTAIGGVAGALARHADAVIAGLVPTLRPAARRVLMRLVTPEGTRARLDDNDLIGGDAGAEAAVAALVRGRLVQARDAAVGGEHASSTYELAHEALLTGWGTLGRWLSEKQGSRVAMRRLELAAGEWERLGQAGDALWGKRQLAEIDVAASELQPRAARFLEASRRRARTARWVRRGIFVGGPVLVACAWLGLTLADHHKQAELVAASLHELRRKVDGRLDEGQKLAAVASQHDDEARALEAAAYAAFDGKDSVGGETRWAAARAAGQAAARAWTDAEHTLEQARSMDPQRDDVKALFADILARRAAAADRRRQNAERDDFLARLALYDENGSRLARFEAPGTVTLQLTPRDSLVRVERYVGDGGRLEVVPIEQPVVDDRVSLPRGSYRLTVAAEGRVTTRVPVVLSPGENVTVAFELPPQEAVPQGFVYVPPGRFLRGSSGDDGLRKGFFHTQPLHQVETAGYLVARHETTFADWISFLEALPPAERARRIPRVQVSVGFRGGLALEHPRDGTWRLTIAPTETRYVANSGEPVRYTGRERNVVQDWRKMPVAGVSFEDALAYAAWLASSGRVPGARLCSEIEWERAARGADGRPFPRGDRFGADDGNIDVTYGKSPSGFGLDEVGSHPDGQGPFGLDDTTGNVWELTTSSEVEGEVVAKGGSFYHDELSGNAANRELPEPTLRDVTVGLRICADLR